VTTSVQLFHTCLVNEFDPDVGMAVVRVLERAGEDVRVPRDQTCCGQPAYNAGLHDEARQMARHTLDVLDATEGPIVIPSGSCTDMLVHQYPELFRYDAAERERACRVSARCCEFSQFLAQTPSDSRGELHARIAFHPSCHLLRGLGVREQPLGLLASVDGIEPVTVRDAEECCGFGGLFSVKNAEISSGMLDRKLSALEQSGADRVVSCDLGCLLQIAGGLHRRGSRIEVQHLAQVLDEAASR
jgi:L-lactate dehydrogenase complex protein LldE